jgi:small subunit ribosomal protein S20
LAAKAPVKKNLSAIKKARQSEKRNARNRVLRSRIKSAMKSVDQAIKEQNKEEMEQALSRAVKAIDGATPKGILHKNNASRKISKLTKSVNAAKAATT